MATRVERNGIEACIGKIKQAIGELETAASAIDTAMNALPESWEGAAYDKARATYEEQYRKLLTQEVPQAVESFRFFYGTAVSDNGIKQAKDRLYQKVYGNGKNST